MFYGTITIVSVSQSQSVFILGGYLLKTCAFDFRPCIKYIQQKINNLFWAYKNSILQCFFAFIFSMLSTILFSIVTPDHHNIANSIEQSGQQNIVQACFHQLRTGCSFFAVYAKLTCPCSMTIILSESMTVLRR